MAIDIIARGLALKNSKSYIFVENYNALLLLTPENNQLYYCINSQGTKWLPGNLGGTYYPKGLYFYSNAWHYAELPYQATQLEVDTGTNNDKFITPMTLKNSTLLSGFEPVRGLDDNYIKDIEKTNLHTHTNKEALDLVSGTNSGDNSTNTNSNTYTDNKINTLEMKAIAYSIAL